MRRRHQFMYDALRQHHIMGQVAKYLQFALQTFVGCARQTVLQLSQLGGFVAGTGFEHLEESEDRRETGRRG